MRKPLFLGLAIVWATIIFVMATSPTTPSAGPALPHLDKLLHFGAFAVLSSLLLLSQQFQNKYIAVCLAIAYGIFIEAVQITIAFRQADFLDVLFDGLGASIVTLIPFSEYEKKSLSFINRAIRLK